MSEIRRDPITGRWVIIAEERAKRPTDFAIEENKEYDAFCPFCEGNEHTTPKEIFAIRDSNSKANKKGWSVRVVPNKFPALHIEEKDEIFQDDMFIRTTGLGAHEVIIETPKHNVSIAEMEIEQIENIIKTYKYRVSDLFNDIRLKYIQVFKNHKSFAGATLSHSHSQLIATPIIPNLVQTRLLNTEQFFQQEHKCLICSIIEKENAINKRIILQNEHFIAISPYASLTAYQISIIPKKHKADFIDINDVEINALAHILKEILSRLKNKINDIPYNFILQTAPNKNIRNNNKINDYYHWHIEILPRLSNIAGFEWATDFYINPIPPEKATEILKQ